MRTALNLAAISVILAVIGFAIGKTKDPRVVDAEAALAKCKQSAAWLNKEPKVHCEKQERAVGEAYVTVFGAPP